MLSHDTVRRAVRTFAQAFLAALLIAAPTVFVADVDVWSSLFVAAGYSGAVALVTFLHNELEDAGRVRDTRHPKGPTP